MTYFAHCVMTGAPLLCGPAILLPLAPFARARPHRRAPSLIGCARTLYGGEGGLFAPVALPLRVEVGEHSTLESIQGDASAILLRDRLARAERLPAEGDVPTNSRDPRVKQDPLWAFAEACLSGRDNRAANVVAKRYAETVAPLPVGMGTYPQWDGTLSGTWVSVEAWQTFSLGEWHDSGFEPASSLVHELRKVRDRIRETRAMDKGIRADLGDKVRPKSVYGMTHGAHRALAPEMMELYGNTLWRETVLPELAALLCFITNLELAGRFLAPVQGLHHDGNLSLHRKVARMALSQIDTAAKAFRHD